MSHVAANWKEKHTIAQMTCLTMRQMQNPGVNLMTYRKSSQIPQVIQTTTRKQGACEYICILYINYIYVRLFIWYIGPLQDIEGFASIVEVAHLVAVVGDEMQQVHRLTAGLHPATGNIYRDVYTYIYICTKYIPKYRKHITNEYIYIYMFIYIYAHLSLYVYTRMILICVYICTYYT